MCGKRHSIWASRRIRCTVTSRKATFPRSKSAKSGYELVSFGMETLAPDTVVDGAIMDAPQVANAISKIFDAQRIKTKNVATSVSGHSVIVKRVPLPLMTEEELYDRIPSEA